MKKRVTISNLRFAHFAAFSGAALMLLNPSAWAGGESTSSDTVGHEIVIGNGPIQLRAAELGASSGYFRRNNGVDGAQTNVNARYEGIVGRVDEHGSLGLMLDPGVTAQVQSTTSDPLHSGTVTVTGISALHVQDIQRTFRRPPEGPRETALVRLRDANEALEEIASRMNYETREYMNRIPDQILASIRPDQTDLSSEDITRICTPLGETSAYYCSSALSSREGDPRRFILARVEKAAALAEARRLHPGQDVVRLSLVAGTSPSSTFTFDLVSGAFQHTWNPDTHVNQTGALVRGPRIAFDTGLTIGRTQAHICGNLAPADFLIGHNAIGQAPRSSAAVYQPSASLCAGVRLGQTRIDNTASYVGRISTSGEDGSIHAISDATRLTQPILGVPVYAEYNYTTTSGTAAPTDNVHSISLGVQN